jgi:hypothetical protein
VGSELRQQRQHLRAVPAERRVVEAECQGEPDEQVAGKACGRVDRCVECRGTNAPAHQLGEIARRFKPGQHQHRVHDPGQQPVVRRASPRGRAARTNGDEHGVQRPPRRVSAGETGDAPLRGRARARADLNRPGATAPLFAHR